MTHTADLAIHDLYAGYQTGVDIVKGATLGTNGRGVTLLVGPNGAGKSTLIKTAFGLLRHSRGKILLNDQDIGSLRADQIKRLGVSYLPQERGVFPQLTVHENLRIGGWILRKDHRRLDAQLERMYDTFVILRELKNRRAHELSGGQARILGIAKELTSEPSILLLDEPTAGLSPMAAGEIYGLIARTRSVFNAKILMVDQNVKGGLGVAEYVYFMNLGRVAADGSPSTMTIDRIRQLVRESLGGS